jgi:hypothetical protein
MALLLLVALANCAASEDLPREADLRPRFAELGLTPKSQAPRGCCSLFALTGVLEYEMAQVGQGTPVRVSEEFLNWGSHQSNGRRTDGSFFSDALRGLAIFGVCQESLLHYASQFDPDLQPSQQALDEARARRNVSARWVKDWDVKTGMTDDMLREMRRQIAAGHPVAIGLRWPKKEEYGPDNVLTMPPAGEVFDGHSIALVGYRDVAALPGGGAFLFRNSSGPGWREKGYARLPYAYVQAYGNDALSLRLGEPTTDEPSRHALTGNRQARSPLEAEALRVLETRECQPSVQSMAPWGAGLWSGGSQLFCGARPGAALTLAVPAGAGRYEVNLFATRAPDFSIVRAWLDERPAGGSLDRKSVV